MKIHLLLLLSLSPIALLAEEEAAPKSSAYEPKIKSAFKPEGLLNGFIPVGYEPPKVEGPKEVVILGPPDFKLTSTILGSPSVAVINGRDHAEKEWFETDAKGKKVQVYLLQVSDGSVILHHPKVGNFTVFAAGR